MGRSGRQRLKRLARRTAISAERHWDSWRLARATSRPPRALRFDGYIGHGDGERVVVRGRLLDGHEPSAATDG